MRPISGLIDLGGSAATGEEADLLGQRWAVDPGDKAERLPENLRIGRGDLGFVKRIENGQIKIVALGQIMTDHTGFAGQLIDPVVGRIVEPFDRARRQQLRSYVRRQCLTDQ